MGMSIEQLYKKCYEVVSVNGKYEMGKKVLDEFFADNLVIPKDNKEDIVYEYLYYDSKGKTDWLTDEEYQLMMDTEPCEAFIAIETKRERK